MKKRVLACGTFDLLHPGHLHFLKQARSLGDELHVCVARDYNVFRIKQRLPLWDEHKRALELSTLPFVDCVHLGHKEDFLYPVELIRPHIIALGYDQSLPCTMEDYLAEHHITLTRLTPHQEHTYKSSLLRPHFTDTIRCMTS